MIVGQPNIKTVRLTLPKLHSGQIPIVNDQHRVVVAAMGSKFGKTFSMGIWLAQQAWNRYQSVNWWCGPTQQQATIAWNQILLYLPRERVKINRSNHTIYLLQTNGSIHSRIEFRSADRPETLRGEGVHAAVVDEAAFWNYDSYISVWTTLSRTRGKLRIISTPKGRNYFYDEWLKGWDEDLRQKNPEFMSYQLPTHANPYVPRESLEEFKANFPADVYRQEILAEFLDESAGVFHNILGCATATERKKPMVGRRYVLGIDWAKQDDWTVLTIADVDEKEIVYIDRFTGIDWNVQIDKAIRLAREWNDAAVIMDSTGVGDVPLDSMSAVYPHTEGYQISNNAAKVALIQKLQFAMERGDIKYPKNKVLINELQTYGYTMSSTGKFIFGAPTGYHDDCVISLALTNWKLSETPLVYRYRSVRGV